MPNENIHHRHSAEVCLYQFNCCPDCGSGLHPTTDGLECRSATCGSVWFKKPHGPLPKDLFRVSLPQPLKPEPVDDEKAPKGGKGKKGKDAKDGPSPIDEILGATDDAPGDMP